MKLEPHGVGGERANEPRPLNCTLAFLDPLLARPTLVVEGGREPRAYEFERDGERLVYTTPPFHFHTDGKMSVNTLIWEKVK